MEEGKRPSPDIIPGVFPATVLVRKEADMKQQVTSDTEWIGTCDFPGCKFKVRLSDGTILHEHTCPPARRPSPGRGIWVLIVGIALIALGVVMWLYQQGLISW